MPFLTPLKVMLLNDRAEHPWILLEPLVYYSDLTGETYAAPTHFRTDGSSVPMALAAVPVVGQFLVIRFFGQGVWQGFKEGVLHDFLRRKNKATGEPPVPSELAHLLFREALTNSGYSDDLVDSYYDAVVAFNSND